MLEDIHAKLHDLALRFVGIAILINDPYQPAKILHQRGLLLGSLAHQSHDGSDNLPVRVLLLITLGLDEPKGEEDQDAHLRAHGMLGDASVGFLWVWEPIDQVAVTQLTLHAK